MLTQGKIGRDPFEGISVIFIFVESDQFSVYCPCALKRRAKADYRRRLNNNNVAENLHVYT